MQGTVVKYHKMRGFGFLVDDQDVRQLIFFHISSWHSAAIPEVGCAVSYELGPGKAGKGPEAKDVRVAASAQTLSGPAAVLAEATIAEVKR